MKTLIGKIKSAAKTSLAISGLKGGSRALLASRLAQDLKRPIVLITASEEQAAVLFQDLPLFTSVPVLHYPGFDIPPLYAAIS